MSAKLLADDVERPDNDRRSYRVVSLPNGITALLVSDPSIAAKESKKKGVWLSRWLRRPMETETEEGGSMNAACALSVGVGYLSDPLSLQGCAHFVEHMLFMGTRRFPKENGWNHFLSRNGGADNGETHAETTVFYFDVHPSFLRPALERFGGFFSCPLFKWDGSRREVRLHTSSDHFFLATWSTASAAAAA